MPLSLEELLIAAMDARIADVHTAMPCRVESYDASKQTVSVKPMLKRAVQGVDGEDVIEDLPVLPNVPVAFPRGGGYFAAFPLQAGDFVWVMFAERSIATWRQSGEAADPADKRMHPLTGAMAYPGGYPNGAKLSDASATDCVLGKDGSSQQIVFKANGDITLNHGLNGVARVGDHSGDHVHAAGTLVAGPYPVTGATATFNPVIPENSNPVKS